MAMDNYLTPEQVAGKLSIQARTLRGWLRTGKLKGAKLNRLWRIREEDIKTFLLDQPQGPWLAV